jgi:hypothetical protein
VARAGSSNELTSELETLRTQARSMVSRFQEASSYAAAQSAYGRVLNSVGIDLMPEQVAGSDLPSVSRAIQVSLLDGEKQVFPQLADAVAVVRPIQITVTGLPPRVDGDAIRAAVGKVMTGNQFVLGDGADSLAVELHYAESPSKTTKRAQWDVTVQDRAGKRLLTQSYRSYLPDEATTRSVAALAEAATLSVMADVRRLAVAPETAAINQP